MSRKTVRKTLPQAAPAGTTEGLRLYQTLGLLLAGIGLLTLSFAPIYQAWCAWIGLVPWLVVVHKARSMRSAFLWSWLGGTGFFVANMWWLENVTIPGMIALLVYLGVYWGLAAVVLRTGRVLEASRTGQVAVSALLIAAVWTGLEWVRGNLFTGLPWLYLGHTQSPILPLCQIADTLGVYGVSFWVVLVNATIALWLLNGRRWRVMIASAAIGVAVVLLVLGYGLFRMSEKTVMPGPSVLVVQANYPQDLTGEKSGTAAEHLEFHERATEEALQRLPGADLAVWSETMMPPLNRQARQALTLLAGSTRDARLAEEAQDAATAHQHLMDLARRHHMAILTGGLYMDWVPEGLSRWLGDRRNSAFLYSAGGELMDLRYDKIHLVPFGEFIPFKKSLPWLFKLLLAMTPYDHDYTLTPGADDALTVFAIPAPGGLANWRFVTPICFEDIDSRIVARMFRPVDGSAKKRADFIVNITNDGWFKANENAQHLQAAVFRSIENRVPTARSVNTGISGFIDSCGRTSNLIPARTTGATTAVLGLDSRLSLYTRFGDFFAAICVLVTAAVAARPLVRRWMKKRAATDN